MGWLSPLVPFLSSVCLLTSGYLSDSWAMMASERPSAPRCTPIPANLTICKGIQYTQMRLPNLLEHETLTEAVEQSADWQSLLNLNCHSDTQLFLCSLFAPVCLPQMDKEILPCRSLCRVVKMGCEGRMQQYGFPWPEMLSCERFPENEMCIKPIAMPKAVDEESCESCSQVGTYENILDHFCRSHLVMKARLHSVVGHHLRIRNGRSLKKSDRRRSIADTTISLSSHGKSCPCAVTNSASSDRFLIMANPDSDGNLVASLVLPWQKDKAFKRAVHQFQRLNCKSLGREIRESASRRPHSYYNLRKYNLPDRW